MKNWTPSKMRHPPFGGKMTSLLPEQFWHEHKTQCESLSISWVISEIFLLYTVALNPWKLDRVNAFLIKKISTWNGKKWQKIDDNLQHWELSHWTMMIVMRQVLICSYVRLITLITPVAKEIKLCFSAIPRDYPAASFLRLCDSQHSYS